jgi:hypothetical protein
VVLTEPVPNEFRRHQVVQVSDFAQGYSGGGFNGTPIGDAGDVPVGDAFLAYAGATGGVEVELMLPGLAMRIGGYWDWFLGNGVSPMVCAIDSAGIDLACANPAGVPTVDWATNFLGFEDPEGRIAGLHISVGHLWVLSGLTFETIRTP